MVPHKANRRRNYTPRTFEPTPEMTPDTMAGFMVSSAGHYNSDRGMAALAALDHARDYTATDGKFRFWMNVYEIISLWNLNISKVKENWPMTEHGMELLKGEKLRCTTCYQLVEGVRVQLVADPTDDERIGEILCPKCSDKRS